MSSPSDDLAENIVWPPAPMADPDRRSLRDALTGSHDAIGRWYVRAMIPTFIVGTLFIAINCWGLWQDFYHHYAASNQIWRTIWIREIVDDLVINLVDTIGIIWLYVGFVIVADRENWLRDSLWNLVLIFLPFLRALTTPFILGRLFSKLAEHYSPQRPQPLKAKLAFITALISLLLVIQTMAVLAKIIILPSLGGHNYYLTHYVIAIVLYSVELLEMLLYWIVISFLHNAGKISLNPLSPQGSIVPTPPI